MAILGLDCVSRRAMAAAAAASELAAAAHATLTRDVPELLRLCARSLAAAPIPSTPAGWLRLSRAEALKLAPTLGCVLFVCALPACALLSAPEHLALCGLQDAIGHRQQGAFACPTGTEERHALAWLHLQTHIGQPWQLPARHADVAQFQHGTAVLLNSQVL